MNCFLTIETIKKYDIKVELHSNKKIMVVLKLKFRCFLEEVI